MQAALELADVVLNFRDGVDLSRQLAVTEQVRDCYAKRWTDYAVGVTIDVTDPAMQRIVSDFRRNDDVLGLLEAIATSDLFRFRAAGGAQ